METPEQANSSLEPDSETSSEYVNIPESPRKPELPPPPKRTDIQFLRALAVLMVVFFHLDLSFARGGFCGVDIFFVISGYLVGGSFIRDTLKIGTSINLLDFLAKRIQRLTIPTVVCQIFILFCIALTKSTFGREAEGASLHIVNIFFYQDQQAYFKTDPTKSFFLHFWSLAVEEQIYLGLPRTHLCSIFLCLELHLSILQLIDWSTVTSFTTMFFVDPTAKFFLPGPRLWQFLIGTIVAMFQTKLESFPSLNDFLRPKTQLAFGNIIRWLCIGLLILCGNIISNVDWPNVVTLVPVVLTGIVLSFDSPISFLPFQLIGDWSFSIYLYHWPIIRVLKSVWPYHGYSAAAFYFAFVLFTLVLSLLSYYFVERPTLQLRYPSIIWFCIIIFTSAGLILLTGLVPRAMAPPIPQGAYKGSGGFLAGAMEPTLQSIRAATEQCESSITVSRLLVPDPYLKTRETSNPDLCLLMIGDSHVTHYGPAIQALAARLGIVKPIFEVESPIFDRNVVRDDVDFTPSKRFINMSLPPQFLECKKRLTIFGVLSGLVSLRPKAEAFISHTKQAIERFASFGCVVTLGDTPSFMMLTNDTFDYTPCGCLRFLETTNQTKCGRPKDQVIGMYKGRSYPSHLKTMESNPNVSIQLLEDQVCSPSFCPVVYNSVPMYFDADHFTSTFMGLFAPTFVEMVIETSGCVQKLLNP